MLNTKKGNCGKLFYGCTKLTIRFLAYFFNESGFFSMQMDVAFQHWVLMRTTTQALSF